MLKKLNNKGFTMVELLVAMAIMGLLVIMAFPTIRAIQTNNNKTKYEEYGKAVISASKIYADSYAEDLFTPDITNEFKVITLQDLVKKDLIKDINISDSSCINGKSNVTVVKYNNDYAYCLHLYCTLKGDETKKLYEEENRKGSCADFKKVEVTYSYNGPTEKTAVYEIIKGDDSYIVLSPNVLFGFTTAMKNDHHAFEKWSSSLGDKSPGDKVTINENTTFTAKTHLYKYTIKYTTSGLTGVTGTMGDTQCTYGSSCPLRTPVTYKKDYFTFDKWKYNSLEIPSNSNMQTDFIAKDKIDITSDNQIINLTTVMRKNVLKIGYNANGGSLQSAHSNRITLASNVLKVDGNATHHTLKYDEKLTSDGLSNWNNSGWINVIRPNYSITSGQEWNTASNGTGTTFNQTSAYTAQQLCPDIKTGDCTKTMYTNWKMNKPNCTVTATPSPPSTGWYKSNVTLNLNTTGVISQYGLDRNQNSTNGKKSITASAEGNITYYGFVKNAAGTNSCSRPIKLDKTPPTASITLKSQSAGYNTYKVNVTIKAKDTASGISKYCLTKGTSCTPNTNLTGTGSANSEKTTSTTYNMSSSQDGASSKLTVCVSDIATNSKCYSSTAYKVYQKCSQTINNGAATCGTYGACSKSCGGGVQYATKTQKKKDKFTGVACNSVTTSSGCSRACNTQACCGGVNITTSKRDGNNGGNCWSCRCSPGETRSGNGLCERVELHYHIEGCDSSLTGKICYYAIPGAMYVTGKRCDYAQMTYSRGRHGRPTGSGEYSYIKSGHACFLTNSDWYWTRSVSGGYAEACNKVDGRDYCGNATELTGY